MNISDESKWKKVPLKDFLEPKDNYVCVCDRYWWVTDCDELLFYKCFDYYSMQCNPYLKIMNDIPEGCRVEFFKVLYLPDLYYYGSER